ncbi:hypothetical protein G5714_011163 [Onychostoma macrolepis]|uniref:Uncharacterized protein n=1 Tax=Onychostoma macrolepis TaxID=369639 RepID=A0A7J6CMX9_9TELE|nr:hypothetical protein G5714_011163 [Onychostoma macrolepis]
MRQPWRGERRLLLPPSPPPTSSQSISDTRGLSVLDNADQEGKIPHCAEFFKDNAFSAKRGLIAAGAVLCTPCILIMDCCHSRSYNFLPLWLSYTFPLFYFKHKTSRGDGTYAGIHTNAKLSPGILIDAKQSNSTLTGHLRLVLSCQRQCESVGKTASGKHLGDGVLVTDPSLQWNEACQKTSV